MCTQNGLDAGHLYAGNRVEITATYYEKVVSVILEFGVKLVQVVWRKLLPHQIGVVDEEINRLCYDLIKKRKYSQAFTMLRFVLYEMKKHGKEAIRKMMVVNLANAEKLDGNKAKSEDILAKEDWSASLTIIEFALPPSATTFRRSRN